MDEVRKHNSLYPPFIFLFRLNKAKIVFSVCFLNYTCNKNIPKIKVLQMSWKFNMFFLEYLRKFGIENTPWGPTMCPRGWRACPPPWGAAPASWAHGGPPPLNLSPIHFVFLQKKSSRSSNPCSCSSCYHFRSPCGKLHLQNCFGGLFFGMWLLHWSN